jgi:hypothetical protein
MVKPVAQVFLSYAHLDNAKPHGFDIGWVDRLFDALDVELPTHGVEVRWWRDRRDLEPESYFDESILSAVSHSDAFVAILSPVYPQRPFCLKELAHFLEKAGSTDEQRRRVLKVVKRPIADPDISRVLPDAISGSGEFLFYTVDRQTNRVRLFLRSTGEIARQEEFWDAIEELAAAIARTVNQIKPRSLTLPDDVAVYVAEPSDDQRQNYRSIRSELMAAGFKILPDERIPDDYGEAIAFIDDQLSRCMASVHLLGERSGYLPSTRGGEPAKPIARLQIERAAVRCDSDPFFRRLIWARNQLEPTQEDQSALLLDLKSGAALRETDEFVSEPLELFKNTVLDRLRRSHVRPARGELRAPRPILLLSKPEDQAYVEDLAAALHAARYEVFSLALHTLGSDDERRISELASQVDGTIVLCSKPDTTWTQTVLGVLHKTSAARADGRPTVRAVLFGGGAEARSFRSHYCNLILTGSPGQWENVRSQLHAEFNRPASS